jgi:hypothetical protein
MSRMKKLFDNRTRPSWVSVCTDLGDFNVGLPALVR